jgi:hypothetical protein
LPTLTGLEPLVSLPRVGVPEAALGLEMSGALGRASVRPLPTLVTALLNPPALGRLACAAALYQGICGATWLAYIAACSLRKVPHKMQACKPI